MPSIPKGNPKRPWHVERAAQEGRTQKNDKIYNSRRWKQLRLLHLAEHPLCVVCLVEGKTEPARVVDHIKPINWGGKPWDRANLQSLCDRHHNQKNARESRGPQGGC